MVKDVPLQSKMFGESHAQAVMCFQIIDHPLQMISTEWFWISSRNPLATTLYEAKLTTQARLTTESC